MTNLKLLKFLLRSEGILFPQPSLAVLTTVLPRYKDISPYDYTRVFLVSCPTGDFINANQVVMEIPGSGNRFFTTLYVTGDGRN